MESKSRNTIAGRKGEDCATKEMPRTLKKKGGMFVEEMGRKDKAGVPVSALSNSSPTENSFYTMQ